MKTNRRNFLISAGLAGAGLLEFPNLASSEENFNLKSKGFAIQDPLNKQKIRGFVYIPSIWGEQLKVSYQLGRVNLGLVEAIKKYSGIDAKIDSRLYLSSQHLIEYPFVYITTDNAFELTKTERNNFENYLRNGGFAVLESSFDIPLDYYSQYDSPPVDYSQSEASLKQMARDVLKEDSRFLPIPNSHHLYHCFFDFNDGPPQGTEYKLVYTNPRLMAGTDPDKITFPKPRPYLEGIILDDRLSVVYSGKGYWKKWKDISNNDPQQKMAVNFVVYALTQKGGIAEKLQRS